MAKARERPRHRSVRLVAVLAAFTFGCVTVRAPASVIGEEVALRDGRAEPQLELWIEGNEAVPPAEVAAAAAEARAVLAEALQGQADPGEDWILVARARGLTRTASRRHEQVAARVGLVVGAVVLIALIVVAVVASGKGGGKGGGAAHPGAPSARGPGSQGVPAGRPPAAGPSRALPFAGSPRPGGSTAGSGVGGAVRPPPPAVRPPPPAPVPAPAWTRPPWPHHRHDAVAWSFQGSLELDLWGPVEPPPLLLEEERLAWRELPAEVAPPGADAVAGAEGQAPGLRGTRVALPPPPPLPVEARGYFDGDTLEVELTLVDRATGLAAWRKTAAGEIDPRDQAAVRALVRPLLSAEGWLPVEAAAGLPSE